MQAKCFPLYSDGANPTKPTQQPAVVCQVLLNLCGSTVNVGDLALPLVVS